MAIGILQANARILAAAVLLDLVIGDPVYAGHPVRLMGRTLAWLEKHLLKVGADAYGGGVALFLLLAAIWAGGTSAAILGLDRWSHAAAWTVHLFLLYSCLSLGDLLRHAWAVETAARRNDLEGARAAIGRLVGRDTEHMDIAACRRAAIESLGESLTDGFVSPLFWYVLVGLPGIVLFKVISTMDSMVGYKTPRYLKFGWCGARLDDVMNLIPAPLTWVFLSALALVLPGCSAMKALLVGWRQHAVFPSPNSGWSEAATAGAIQRRLVGPIWARGALVTDIWLGDPADAPAGTSSDFSRAATLIATTGLVAAILAIVVVAIRN